MSPLELTQNSVNIAGTVGRNAYIGCDSLNFSRNDNTDNDNTNKGQKPAL